MTDSEAIRAIAENVADLIGVSNKILDRLEALERGRAQTAPASAQPFTDEPVPQPQQIVSNPERVEIHWSKNKGKTLGELTDRQLSFYAAKWELRERENGGYWENDLILLNAARTLWHQRRKTLNGSAIVPPAAKHDRPAAAENLDEDVPF